MEKLPFTSFDFWGYLASGFLLLCAVDASTDLQLITRPNWTVIEGILAIVVAYVAGHVNAGLSSLVLERGLVGHVFGWPRDGLFEISKLPVFVRKLMGFYYGTLPVQTRAAILSRAREVGVSSPGEALFWLAFSYSRRSERTMVRLSDFLNQFSFCRNVSMVLLLDAAILWWAYQKPTGNPLQLVLARICLLVGIALFLRYLKFLRHYSLEVFTNYAYPAQDNRSA